MFDQTCPVVTPTSRETVVPKIEAIATALPDQRWQQRDTYQHMADRVPAYRRKVIEGIFTHGGIESRYLSLAPEDFDPAPPAEVLHEGFKENALKLAEAAALKVLEQSNLQAADIGGLVVATSTGYLCPGVAALIAPKIGLPRDAMRTEIVGAGCAGALPALRRGHDFVIANPEERVLIVCVEVCSACVYVDNDLETVVGNAICADGAAAIVLSGPATEGTENSAAFPRISHFQTAARPEYLDKVGFQHPEGRLRIVLSNQIPKIAAEPVKDAAERTLTRAGLDFADIDHWVAHPGGRRVLDRLSNDLGFGEDDLSVSRSILKNYGNMSSPTVLFVLAKTIQDKSPRPGEIGMLVALGPGMVAESALLQW